MINRRRKGDDFERKVKKHLQTKGYFTVRQSSSSFPDLIALSKNNIIFIECKTNKYINKQEKEQLKELNKIGDIAIAYNNKGKIQFTNINYKPKNIKTQTT
jgi:Holliday junction resolvase